ncbi:hypothetical protein [uncultured Chryseobacterium sp.]|uniref:hypothetical protein n=2 Tax=uncultured Chryseobacterium sp. TaxID=259322 RepID=UPI0025E54813|nr:hypothetical protein [uncultured Chryseobacterium sp.]
MNKLEFKKVDTDFRVVKSTNDKYLLLSLFIGQYRFPDNIQEIIDMLKSVKNGSKTWKEVIDPWMFLQINDAGDFKCDKEKAFFIADSSTPFQNLEMPLQELIHLLEDWKAFMS